MSEPRQNQPHRDPTVNPVTWDEYIRSLIARKDEDNAADFLALAMVSLLLKREGKAFDRAAARNAAIALADEPFFRTLIQGEATALGFLESPDSVQAALDEFEHPYRSTPEQTRAVLTELKALGALIDDPAGRSPEWQSLVRSLKNVDVNAQGQDAENTINRIMTNVENYTKNKKSVRTNKEGRYSFELAMDAMGISAKISKYARVRADRQERKVNYVRTNRRRPQPIISLLNRSVAGALIRLGEWYPERLTIDKVRGSEVNGPVPQPVQNQPVENPQEPPAQEPPVQEPPAQEPPVEQPAQEPPVEQPAQDPPVEQPVEQPRVIVASDEADIQTLPVNEHLGKIGYLDLVLPGVKGMLGDTENAYMPDEALKQNLATVLALAQSPVYRYNEEGVDYPVVEREPFQQLIASYMEDPVLTDIIQMYAEPGEYRNSMIKDTQNPQQNSSLKDFASKLLASYNGLKLERENRLAEQERNRTIMAIEDVPVERLPEKALQTAGKIDQAILAANYLGQMTEEELSHPETVVDYLATVTALSQTPLYKKKIGENNYEKVVELQEYNQLYEQLRQDKQMKALADKYCADQEFRDSLLKKDGQNLDAQTFFKNIFNEYQEMNRRALEEEQAFAKAQEEARAKAPADVHKTLIQDYPAESLPLSNGLYTYQVDDFMRSYNQEIRTYVGMKQEEHLLRLMAKAAVIGELKPERNEQNELVVDGAELSIRAKRMEKNPNFKRFVKDVIAHPEDYYGTFLTAPGARKGRTALQVMNGLEEEYASYRRDHRLAEPEQPVNNGPQNEHVNEHVNERQVNEEQENRGPVLGQ